MFTDFRFNRKTKKTNKNEGLNYLSCQIAIKINRNSNPSGT